MVLLLAAQHLSGARMVCRFTQTDWRLWASATASGCAEALSRGVARCVTVASDGTGPRVRTRYRITARVIRDGQPFTTEPEFGATVDDAKARLWQWVHECGWAFVAWNDLCRIEEVPSLGMRRA